MKIEYVKDMLPSLCLNTLALKSSAAVRDASHSTCHILFPCVSYPHVAFLLQPAFPVRARRLLNFSPLLNISNRKDPFVMVFIISVWDGTTFY
jgi:hypothetical protein